MNFDLFTHALEGLGAGIFIGCLVLGIVVVLAVAAWMKAGSH